MVKVMHYAPGFRSGGIESRMLDWYRNMNRNIVQFVLVKLNNEDDTPNIREFVALGGKYYNLSPFGLKSSLTFEKKLIKIIMDEDIDIIHVHDPNSGLFALRAAKKCGIKCRIFHSRTTSFLPNEKNVFVKKMFMSQTPRYATDYWACSKEAGLWGCGKKYESEIVVINNGIQDDLFIFDDNTRNQLRKELGIEDKKVIGTIGRISPQKNLPFLFDIVASLHNEDPDFVLLMVGDGDQLILENYFKQKADISPYVITVGAKKNVWDYYMAMDVFCGASLYEGFGTTAIESQATGLPTILSTSFPETVVVTNFVKRLELNDISPWVDNIKNMIGKRYPDQGMNGVISHGYSARMVAKQLEDFYISYAK